MSSGFALSVILPAYNEEALLTDTAHRLRRTLDELGLPSEIVIVNDGSRDRTREIADELARSLSNVVACHQENQGIGGAFMFARVRRHVHRRQRTAVLHDLQPVLRQRRGRAGPEHQEREQAADQHGAW